MLKVGFVTCVELGLSCMHEIYSVGGTLDLAITLNDDKAVAKSGRVYLDEFCDERDIDLLKINHINDAEVQEAIARHSIDWLFIVGWSQIAGADTLNAPSRGCLGIHPTPLPIGRGRAPIPWAIIKGLEETGVTLFVLDEGVDTGPIVAQQLLPLAQTETATELYEKINELHRVLIKNCWEDLVHDQLVPQVQDDSLATMWPGRRPEDGRISADMTVQQVDRLVRGVTRPYPGAFFESGDTVIRIWAGSAREHEDECIDETWRSITLADGVYIAKEWELDTPPASDD